MGNDALDSNTWINSELWFYPRVYVNEAIYTSLVTIVIEILNKITFLRVKTPTHE